MGSCGVAGSAPGGDGTLAVETAAVVVGAAAGALVGATVVGGSVVEGAVVPTAAGAVLAVVTASSAPTEVSGSLAPHAPSTRSSATVAAA